MFMSLPVCMGIVRLHVFEQDFADIAPDRSGGYTRWLLGGFAIGPHCGLVTNFQWSYERIYVYHITHGLRKKRQTFSRARISHSVQMPPPS